MLNKDDHLKVVLLLSRAKIDMNNFDIIASIKYFNFEEKDEMDLSEDQIKFLNETFAEVSVLGKEVPAFVEVLEKINKK